MNEKPPKIRVKTMGFMLKKEGKLVGYGCEDVGAEEAPGKGGLLKGEGRMLPSTWEKKGRKEKGMRGGHRDYLPYRGRGGNWFNGTRERTGGKDVGKCATKRNYNTTTGGRRSFNWFC